MATTTNVELVALGPAAKVPHDVRVVALAQHLDLHHQVLKRLVLLQLHDLHCDYLSCRQIAALLVRVFVRFFHVAIRKEKEENTERRLVCGRQTLYTAPNAPSAIISSRRLISSGSSPCVCGCKACHKCHSKGVWCPVFGERARQTLRVYGSRHAIVLFFAQRSCTGVCVCVERRCLAQLLLSWGVCAKTGGEKGEGKRSDSTHKTVEKGEKPSTPKLWRFLSFFLSFFPPALLDNFYKFVAQANHTQTHRPDCA